MNATTRIPLTILALAAAFAVALLALSAGDAGAIVPPKNCKTIEVKNKRYNIKSDQVRCKLARYHARRYLKSRIRPRGYKCYRYSGSKLVAKCVNMKASPDRTIYMFRR